MFLKRKDKDISTQGIFIDRSLIQTEKEMLSRWGNFKKPLVSISCITYNHEKFIRDTIDGFLIQKTKFPFEILIHDDASTDRTPDIIREFKERYPKIIKPIYQNENQYSKGKKVGMFNFERARGDYIALCEGDDYWIDCLKLKKQIMFLAKNKNYSICHHKVIIKDECSNCINIPNIFMPSTTGVKRLAKTGNYIETCSAVFRKETLLPTPDWYSCCSAGDYALWITIPYDKKIKCIFSISSVSRIHPDGLWRSRSNIKNLIETIELLNVIKKNINIDIQNELNCQISNIESCLINQGSRYKKNIIQKTTNKLKYIIVNLLIIHTKLTFTIYKTVFKYFKNC